MNYRTEAGVVALVLLLPASVSEAVDRLPSYRFTTLYSAAHRLLPDLLKGCPTSGQTPTPSTPPTETRVSSPIAVTRVMVIENRPFQLTGRGIFCGLLGQAVVPLCHFLK